MGGKAALLLVIGFSVLMGYTLINMNTAGSRAVTNMSKYNAMTNSHNMASAAANIAMAKFYQDTTWIGSFTQSFTGQPYNGSFTATAISINGGAGRQVTCVSSCPYSPGKTVNDTVVVYLSTNTTNSFTLYAWMTNVENGVYWITNDTVWGRVHSNDNLYVSGSPVFMQKVTTTKGFSPAIGKTDGSGNKNLAIFKNPPQPETGVAKIDYPTDLSGLASAATTGGKKYTSEIWITLDPGTSASGDGLALVRNSSSGAVIDSVHISALPNYKHVIASTKAIHVQGTLDGQLTIASLGQTSPTTVQGNVIIENDIRYAVDPRTSTSTDVLGLVADNDVIIADNTANDQNRDHYIDASVFARTGSFTANNYDTGSPRGNLRLYGSIVQNTRGAVGTFQSGNLKTGYSKRYRYDDRLSDPNFRPDAYPGFIRKTYAITNWWESYKVMSFDW